MGTVLSLLYHTTLDTAAGSLVAAVSEKIFGQKWDDVFHRDPEEHDEVAPSKVVFWSKLSRTFLQMAFIVLMSSEIRSLYTDPDKEDNSMGGLMFIAAVSQTPLFWERVRELSFEIKDMVLKSVKTV